MTDRVASKLAARALSALRNTRGLEFGHRSRADQDRVTSAIEAAAPAALERCLRETADPDRAAIEAITDLYEVGLAALHASNH